MSALKRLLIALRLNRGVVVHHTIEVETEAQRVTKIHESEIKWAAAAETGRLADLVLVYETKREEVSRTIGTRLPLSC